MSEAALYGVDAFTDFSEAGNHLGDVVRVPMAQTQLTVLVVFTQRVHVALHRDEEAEIVATSDAGDFDAFTEWHADGHGVVLTVVDEGPGETVAGVGASEGQVAASVHGQHLHILLFEVVNALRRVRVRVVTQTQLALLVAAPH